MARFTRDKILIRFNFLFFLILHQNYKQKITCSSKSIPDVTKPGHGLNNILLAFLFKVSRATVYQVFSDIITTMYAKLNHLPHKYLIQEFHCLISISFSNIRQIRHLSSHIKIKIHSRLSSITSSVAISFLSELWMGSISDKQITIKSGLIIYLKNFILFWQANKMASRGKKAILKTLSF